MPDIKKKSEGFLSSFISYLKEKKGLTIFLVALLVLLAVFLAFSFDSNADKTAEKTDESEKLEELCSSIKNVGRCRVMLYYTENTKKYGQSQEPRVESVVIVCQGADKPQVRAELTSLFSSLYGIGANRIFVAKLK